jgi:beta-phosphoglucomutase-like phosphatase (HAD superfamily)
MLEEIAEGNLDDVPEHAAMVLGFYSNKQRWQLSESCIAHQINRGKRRDSAGKPSLSRGKLSVHGFQLYLPFMRMIRGIKASEEEIRAGFREKSSGGKGLFKTGKDGVLAVMSPLDQKSDFIVYEDKTLVYVHSQLGYPAIYELRDPEFQAPARAVLMDLDGTSVRSERFWMWIIEQTTASLLGQPGFSLEEEDIPHVSGHSVSEHLEYCIRKYCPDKKLEEARREYFRITHYEMNEILEGRGNQEAFVPSPGLKEFLLSLKAHEIKIGLVTSGLHEKGWPEILSAFRTMDLGDPRAFYDAIITAGYPLRKGHTGTLGELAPKPHPWLYAETARIGLEIPSEQSARVIGMEDSSAGVLSIRLAGYSAIGISDGNIEQSGMRPLLSAYFDHLTDALPMITGKG